ncbi:hypothetical protein [Olleya sp. Bg11-27]|uniref:hypothetical protein n=1 Tax=Olleya sp. Bg11-27 TaxID=2058135 RepID=UPI000C31736E|nr:hypothetical protein [Olleya sp. Bg11-27]AUC75524.1 hypothetical protein CW732_07485 [Olleya sp. Bg11-27]
MTTTRKYYDSLIDAFTRINKSNVNEPKEYFDAKSELSHLINRILKFDLFPLTFTSDFFDLLESESIKDFDNQKITLVNELHFELIECLWTTRLRFGGELIQYIAKIKIALLNLNIKELELFEKIKTEPTHNYFPESYNFESDKEKNQRIKKIRAFSKTGPKKKKLIIKKKDYTDLENILITNISNYRGYIMEHYPSLADNFSFCNKKVIAYITEAMSSDIFEFRIHSYFSTNGDNSVKLHHQFYDFYPSYFHNLEEITDKFAGAHISSLKKEDLSFRNPFSISNIHWELIEIFIQNSSGYEIEEFCTFLLKCKEYKINKGDLSKDIDYDISATKEKKSFAFEIFHHKSRSIAKIKARITNIKKTSSELIPSFIFTSFPGEEIYKILKDENIKTIILQDLIRKHFEVENSQIIHWYIKSKIPTLRIKSNSFELKFEGENLISKLEKCVPGEKNWSEYESIGVDIFSFLFKDNFKKYLSEEQIENNLKNHRRDLLVNNNPADLTSFWSDVKRNYNCSAIIIDFKNYSNKLNSTNFFSVSKYTKKGVGDFAIVFSRKGIDKTAKIEQSELFGNGKLMLEFNDSELVEMIREKIIGKDPIDRLESKKFELVKKY